MVCAKNTEKRPPNEAGRALHNQFEYRIVILEGSSIKTSVFVSHKPKNKKSAYICHPPEVPTSMQNLIASFSSSPWVCQREHHQSIELLLAGKGVNIEQQ